MTYYEAKYVSIALYINKDINAVIIVIIIITPYKNSTFTKYMYLLGTNKIVLLILLRELRGKNYEKLKGAGDKV